MSFHSWWFKEIREKHFALTEVEISGLDWYYKTFVEKSIKKEEITFNRALKITGVKAEESVFIDNSPGNLTIPKKMGFKAIYFDDEKRDYEGLYSKLKESGVDV